MIITCEHGGNLIPQRYVHLFRGRQSDLRSHLGFDRGALGFARVMSRILRARLFFSPVSRLLIDTNRSPENPYLFSDIVKSLDDDKKKLIYKLYYLPHRRRIQSGIMQCIKRNKKVVHLAVHTFTPILKGKPRNTDIGLLYDPSRTEEKNFCIACQKYLRKAVPHITTRRNYPYQGRTDGLTTYLRKSLHESRYLGIELEINQKLSTLRRDKMVKVCHEIVKGLLAALQS